MQVFGTLVDFVNLRSEKYASSSRIPTVVSNLASLIILIFLAVDAHNTYISELFVLLRDACYMSLCLAKHFPVY
jgi:hypothetical protein